MRAGRRCVTTWLPVLKDQPVGFAGMFHIRDVDGYVIGFNDKAALEASDLGKYAAE